MMNIGVIGAGNIGTAMAALLSQSSAQVHLTARGKRAADIAQRGIFLHDRGTVIMAHPKVSEVLTAPMDAVFLCVKSQDLGAALKASAACLTPKTLIIPMVNGLPFWFFANETTLGHVPKMDLSAELSAMIHPEQVWGPVLLMTVRMDEHGRAISSNTPTLSLGPAVEGTDAGLFTTLLDILQKSGVAVKPVPDIRQSIMVKLLANFATNPLSALTGALLDDIGKDQQLRATAEMLADEFRAWAVTLGYDLPSNDWLVDLMLDAGPFPTSMLQDTWAGKPLELDAICRAPFALAQRAGVPMPLTQTVLTLLDTAEKLPLSPADRAAGLFSRVSKLQKGRCHELNS